MLLLLMYTYMLKKHWKMVEALGSDLTICLSTELFFSSGSSLWICSRKVDFGLSLYPFVIFSEKNMHAKGEEIKKETISSTSLKELIYSIYDSYFFLVGILLILNVKNICLLDYQLLTKQQYIS